MVNDRYHEPSKDVLALASTEVDLSPIEEGQSLTVMWRGKPIFIDIERMRKLKTPAVQMSLT